MRAVARAIAQQSDRLVLTSCLQQAGLLLLGQGK